MKKIILYVASAAIPIFAAFSQAEAQPKQGSFGMSAAIALPSGIIPSAGIPTSTLNNLNITYGPTTSFLYLISDNLQLEGGIGYVSVATDTEGDDPDPLSTISIGVQGKYFLSNAPARPYAGIGFSYSSLPTTESANSETTRSLLLVSGVFGGQAFLNDAKTAAMFIQVGLGYNVFSTSTDMDGDNSDTSVSVLNPGGSAFGFSIYL